MSKFNEYLQSLIRSRDISVSRLSRESGVERTSLHRALAGERVLPYQALQLLVRSLELSPGETRKLYQYFNLLFESKAAGQAREIIDRIFSRLSELPDGAADGKQFLHSDFLMDMNGERETFKGQGEISRLILGMMLEELKCEKPRLEVVAPPDIQAVIKGIESIYETGADIMTAHIMCFQTSGDEEQCHLHNLEYLGCVLPCCVLSDKKYHVYYYYNDKFQTRYTDPLPYFLVTHRGVVCLSENIQTAIVLREEEQIAYFHSHFYELKKFCHRLVGYTEAAESRMKHTALRDGYCLVTGQLYRMNLETKKSTIIFTRNCISEFLNTGRLNIFLSGEEEVVDKVRRLEFLHTFLENIRNGHVKGRMVNEMFFGVPNHLAVLASEDFCTCTLSAERTMPLQLQIQERNLCQAFHDWAIHLSDSDWVFDMEKTAEVLTELYRLWQREGD